MFFKILLFPNCFLLLLPLPPPPLLFIPALWQASLLVHAEEGRRKPDLLLQDHADDADADLFDHFVDDPCQKDLAFWLEHCL